MVKRFILLLIVFFPLTTFSQLQNPSSLKWKNIKTEHFLVVFPEGIIERGKETLLLLEKGYEPICQSLGVSPKRMPVFLFNQSITSNGYTTLIPRHIGYYTTPMQEANILGGGDWLQNLTIHEYRHAAQFTNFDKNLLNYAGQFFGNYGKSVAMNLLVPQWVFEGDAVCTETALSQNGRGRMPSFVRDIKALQFENKNYSYDVAYLGSYKNYFPNYYHLGYLLTSNIRRQNGDTLWNKTLEQITKFSIFSKSLKKYTRYNVSKTYKNTLAEYKDYWLENESLHPYQPGKLFNNHINKVWTNYSFPFEIGNDSVLALKSGLNDTPQLVLLTLDNELKLLDLAPVDRIHTNGQYVVWASEVADIRWGSKSYSDIIVFSLKYKTKKILTHNQKYFAPAISPDGKYIAAIEYTENTVCSLVILSALSGNKIKSFQDTEGAFLRMPSWSADGKKIVFTKSKGQFMACSILTVDNGKMENIIAYSTENINNPVFYSNYVLYNTPYSGYDDIYAIGLEDFKHFSIITGKYGVQNPSLTDDSRQIYYEDYTTNGFKVASLRTASLQFEPIEKVKVQTPDFIDDLVALESNGSIYDSISTSVDTSFKITSYYPLAHAIHVHSWSFFPVNNGVGAEIFSNDPLNTLSLSAGVNYFPYDQAHREYFTIQYAKFFPVFESEVSIGRSYTDVVTGDKTYSSVKMDEKLISFGVKLPLNLSREINYTTLDLLSTYNYIFTEFPEQDSTMNFTGITVNCLDLGLNFENYQHRAKRDIYPRWSQTMTFHYWATPFNEGITGNRLQASGNFYFPGLSKNHGTIVMGGYESNSEYFINGVYQLTTSLEFVRGYEPEDFDRFTNLKLIYGMPLFYPDLHLASLLYCKRVRSDFFFDTGQIIQNDEQKLYQSLGVDLQAELVFFRLPFSVEMGVRLSHRFYDNSNVVEFMLVGTPF